MYLLDKEEIERMSSRFSFEQQGRCHTPSSPAMNGEMELFGPARHGWVI